jgi:succinyl-CoA synthetase beta subunit
VFEAAAIAVSSIAMADVDRDGDVDVLAALVQAGQIVWYPNAGGDVGAAQIVHQGAVPMPSVVAAGDVDADGGVDVLWAQPLTLHWNRVPAPVPGCAPGGSSLAATSLELVTGTTFVATLQTPLPGASVGVLAAGLPGVDAAGCGLVLPGLGELLVAPQPAPATLATAAIAGGEAVLSCAVPAIPALVGQAVMLQAAAASPGAVELANGLVATVESRGGERRAGARGAWSRRVGVDRLLARFSLPPAPVPRMKIHEFQAKELLGRFGVAVPAGRECTTPDEAAAAHAALGTDVTVVKAQIHAGGRGKGGGVKLVRSADEARAAAQAMLGMLLKTHQTGPEGQEVRRLWVEEGSAIDRELYVGIVVDRELQMPVMMASSAGGMDIEEVAAKTPEKILKAAFSPSTGLSGADARRLAEGIGLAGDLAEQAVGFLQALAQAFCELDCSLAEINPLVTTKDGQVKALDAKINFDDNGLFRHPDVAALRDVHEEDPKEVEASKHDLSYIALDGNIGCMVNGAGLAMGTMDVIKLHGGEPANFLDVGGGATKEKVTEAFKILLSDAKVQGVLVNIFGGIMRCDVIAEGICAAVKEVELRVPLVVRLEGTNVEQGREILERSGLPIITAGDLDDAASKVCAAVAAGK